MRWVPDGDSERVQEIITGAITRVENALGAGPVHRRRLGSIDTRIVVSGVRGKSSATRWLHDVFHRRGNDTFAKITGDEPITLLNGEERTVERNGQVRLYENERELRRATDVDVAIIENQGIRQYTTRLVSQSFVKPDIVFITNVREDHMDTLGRDRIAIARSLARSVPAGTTVVNGESDPELRSYLSSELRRRNAVVRHVNPPEWASQFPGAEVVFGLNEVLNILGEPPLSKTDTDKKLGTMLPEWRILGGNRLYNAAAVNDVQSTEIIRQALVGQNDTVIQPVVNLRADRRGRTASFRRYFDNLVGEKYAEPVHAVGDGQQVFANTANFDVRTHGKTTPDTLLDAVLADGHPVLIMGNTVTEFMRELDETIQARTTTREPAAIAKREQIISKP